MKHSSSFQSNQGKKELWHSIGANLRLHRRGPSLHKTRIDGNFPLSFAQQHMWQLQRLEPGNPVYNLYAAFHLKGDINVTALEQGIDEIVRRHEILRTRFPAVNRQPVQVVSPYPGVKLSLVIPGIFTGAGGKTNVEQYAREEIRSPFNLEEESLLRIKLFPLAGEEYLLLVIMHHIISDEWSFDLFFRELSILYDAFSTGNTSPLPELPIQYGDFVYWQRQWLQGDILETLQSYWKQQLHDCIPLRLSIDYQYPSISTYRGGRRSLELPGDLDRALKTMSHQEGASLFVTLLAVFKTLLYQFSGQEDIHVCSTAACRSHVKTKKLIGYFNNIVFIRTDLSGKPTFRDLLGRVRRVTLGAYQNQDFPFPMIMDLPGLMGLPSFRAMFGIFTSPGQFLELPGITVNSADIYNGLSNFDLYLYIMKKPGHLTVVIEYKTGLFAASTINRMITHFQVLAERVTANPDLRISDLPGLPGAQGISLKEKTSHRDNAFIPARNEVERQLTKIWERILGVHPMGIHDNFLDLGGHSLSVLRLRIEVERILNKTFNLATLLQAPTIKEFAKILPGFNPPSKVPVLAAEKKEYYPLSSAQKRIYFLQQMDLNSTAYNIFFAVILGKDIDISKLEFALKKLIERHESLKTSFEFINEEPVQRIHDEVEFPVEYYDQKLPTANCQLPTDFVRPFDLSRAPLIRSGLIRLPGDNHIWMVDIHHIISDGTSHTIFMEDFLSLYNDEKLEPLRLRYKDFSEWQNHLLESQEIKPQENYWLDLYDGEIPRLDMPADYKRPELFNFSGDCYHFMLEREDAIKFRNLASTHGATLYMNILAVLNTLFYKYSGQTDIIIGSGAAGRWHVDLQDIIGMFVNTLAMRNYPEGEKTYTSFLKEVSAHSVKAFENQDVQFDDLVDKLDLERDPSRNPLFDILMVVQNFRKIGEGIPGPVNTGQAEALPAIDKNLEYVDYRNATSKFDVTFFIHEGEEDIYINIEYYDAIFKPETIQRLASHFSNIIKAVIAHPSIKLKDIDITCEEEKKQLLYEFNNTAREYPKDKTIHVLFADQAAKTPDKIAVKDMAASLTYRELDRRANQLANYLYFEKQVRSQSEHLVGILTERSLFMVIALLGVLKSGGVYFPIDGSLPEARIKNMIDDAKVEIVISQKKFIRMLNRLQWDCKTFNTFLCMDSVDVSLEEEAEKSELMDEILWDYVWDYVASSATDDITGGGWFTSYTGEPFTKKEMDEYADNILKKITPLLHSQMRVLEIGCGSGLSMYRIAPRVGYYYGTDLSEVVIEKNKKRVKEEGHKNIFLSVLPAHEIDKLDQRDFDLVIINSVIQSFHGYIYLKKVIGKSIDMLNEYGYLFIGDILDQDFKGDLIREMIAFKFSNKGKGKTKIDWSNDLFVSRLFFEDLAVERWEISCLEFSDKIYTIENELTKFRYDTLMTIDKTGKKRKKTKTKQKYQHDIRELEKFPVERVETTIHPGNLAYVIYTSGSTGRPKGVMVGHNNVVRLVKNTNYIEFREDDRLLQTGALEFDASTFEIWGSLLNGLTLYLAAKDELLTPGKLKEIIRKHEIHTMWLTSPLFIQLSRVDIDIFAGLRNLLVGGDVLSPIHINKVKERFPGLNIINGYGPTENTTFSTFFPIDKDYEERIPIGKPISNSTVYILDRCNHFAPVGVVGEIVVGGDGVARGYLNDPELTADKFISAPASSSSSSSSWGLGFAACGCRLYKTGDLARWLPDGNIEFLGRLDEQVKIRGFRIEPGEIEDRLLDHEDIKEALVLTKENKNGEKHLCAYIVSNREFAAAWLREYLANFLPDYMIPVHMIEIENIPLTPNGKVDKKALPAPDMHTRRTYEAPRDEKELKLKRIWQEVLGIRSVGIHDNFFDLGGHSLLAVRLFSEIKKTFHKTLPLATLFQAQTIAQLAKIISDVGWTPSWSSLVVIQPGGSKPPFFCIHSLWGNVLCYTLLARHLGPEQPVYGLQSIGLKDGTVPHSRVEDMAACYIKEIQTIQPEGPYFLGGICFGGMVAYEIAQRLREQGKKVALLALMDTRNPVPYLKSLPLNPGKVKEEDNDKTLTAQDRRIQLVRAANVKARDSYVPRIYQGRVTFFWASDSSGQLNFLHNPQIIWKKLVAGGLEVISIPGNHNTILSEPYIRVLAGKLRACLDQAQAGLMQCGMRTRQSKDKSPIFIHALFRTGSTYVWTKFRNNKNFYCYLEPFHYDLSSISRENPFKWLNDPQTTTRLRHPELSKNYFWEYQKLLEPGQIGMPFFKKSFSFDEFCNTDDNPDAREYINFLMEAAGKKRAVFQFNRTAMRTRWFKENYPDSINIYILRNPHEQWLSYETLGSDNIDIFLVMNLLIASINKDNNCFKHLAETIELVRYHSQTVRDEFMVYRQLLKCYSKEELYFIFYYIWFYSLLENALNADLILNIDQLSDNESYRNQVYGLLRKMQIDNIEFNDAGIRHYDGNILNSRLLNKIESNVETIILNNFTDNQVKLIASKLPTDEKALLDLDEESMRKKKKRKLIKFKIGDSFEGKFINTVRVLADEFVSKNNKIKEIQQKLNKQEDHISVLKGSIMRLENQVVQKEAGIQKIINSYTYKFGRAAIFPFKLIKKLLKE